MKCSVCKNNIPKGTGKMFVRNDGRVYYFCSSKCQRNFNLGRVPKKLKWVSKAKEKKSG